MRPHRTASMLRAACALVRAATLGVVLVGPTAVFAQGISGPSPASASAQARSAVDATNDWPQWTTGRYRITPSDVIQLTFPFVSEFDQHLFKPLCCARGFNSNHRFGQFLVKASHLLHVMNQ